MLFHLDDAISETLHCCIMIWVILLFLDFFSDFFHDITHTIFNLLFFLGNILIFFYYFILKNLIECIQVFCCLINLLRLLPVFLVDILNSFAGLSDYFLLHVHINLWLDHTDVNNLINEFHFWDMLL